MIKGERRRGGGEGFFKKERTAAREIVAGVRLIVVGGVASEKVSAFHPVLTQRTRQETNNK